MTGASSGLGLSIASHLSEAGYRVFGSSRRPGGQAAGSVPFRMVAMDVNIDESVDEGIAALLKETGRIDGVVCNAGLGLAGSIEDTTVDEALSLFQTNFFGVHRVCRAALPHLRKQERASLIVMGSLAGLFGIPFQGFYAASKHALEGYVESLRMELRKTSVRATIVEPGDFKTNFTSGRRIVASVGKSFYDNDFEAALAIMIRDEQGSTADLAELNQCIRDVLEMDEPPVRIAIGPEEQTTFAGQKHAISPLEFERIMAEAYGL